MTKLQTLLLVSIFSAIAWSEWAPVAEFESNLRKQQTISLVH